LSHTEGRTQIEGAEDIILMEEGWSGKRLEKTA
jgi:hypothetical protein